MHGKINIKYIEAKQAKAIYQFKNTKRKLYRTNVAIWYNKICRQNRLTPDYINIRINGKNLRCQKTIGTATQYRLDCYPISSRLLPNIVSTATQYRLNQEIKFLYIKKLKLNEQLYKQHLGKNSQCLSSLGTSCRDNLRQPIIVPVTIDTVELCTSDDGHVCRTKHVE